MNRQFKTSLGKFPGVAALWGLLLLCTLGVAALPTNAASLDLISAVLDTSKETCANGVIDPGETNNVVYTFKNTSGGTISNLKVTLVVDSGNVSFALPAGSSGTTKTIGDLANNASASVTFTFRSDGLCGQTLSPTFTFTSTSSNTAFTGGLDDSGRANATLGQTINTPYSFSNSSSITINDFNSDSAKLGRATPYPSTIAVAGIPNGTGLTGERVSKVTVTLNNVTHTSSRDISALLVAPNGNVMLMRKAGGATTGTMGINGVTLTFDQGASSKLPQNDQIVSGTFKPSDYGSGNLPDAPAGPYLSDLGTLNISQEQAERGTPVIPNGTWKLYVQDTISGDSGVIAGGWNLSITTSKIVCCGAGATFPEITQNNSPSIANVTISEDNLFIDSTASGPKLSSLPTFQIGDLETSGDTLFSPGLSVTSGNQAIIKNSNIRVAKVSSGTDANLALKNAVVSLDFQPEANANGTVPITVTVTDGNGQTATTSFNLIVNSINDLPVFNTFPGNQAFSAGVRTPTLDFTISDVETPANNLIVTATSSDTTVLPNANIFLSSEPDGITRHISFQSATAGQTTVTVKIQDTDGGVTTKDLLIKFFSDTAAPVIPPINNQSVNEDSSVQVSFVVRSGSSSSTPVNSLSLSASVSTSTTTAPSNATAAELLPAGSISFSGSGENRVATITPAANKFGIATITITVTDPNNGKSSTSAFDLTVAQVNQAPTISSIANQTINENGNTGDIAFTVGDRETPVATLTLSYLVSSSTLTTPPTVAFGGGGANRTVKVTPALNDFGKATITITVTDTGKLDGSGVKSTSTSFLLDVTFVNQAPTITSVAISDNITVDKTTPPATPAAPAITESSKTVTLAANSTDLPSSNFEVLEDAGNATSIAAGNKGNFETDGTAKIKEITLSGITAGAGNEFDQSVTISASTSDPGIISSLFFDSGKNSVTPTSSAGASTTLKYRLASNGYGTATVTLTLTDNKGGTTSRKFQIVVDPVNDIPTLAAISNQTGISNQQAAAVPISLSDVETSNANMAFAFTITSDPNSVVKSVTVNASRTVITVVPNSGAVGTATIQVTFTDRGAKDDGAGGSDLLLGPKPTTARSFDVTFINKPPLAPPTLVINPSTLLINEDTAAQTTASITYDTSNSPGGVTLAAASSSEVIVKSANVLFSGAPTDTTRTIIIVPEPDANTGPNSPTGGNPMTITITATDANQLSVSKTITLSITPIEDNPTIAFNIPGSDSPPWGGSSTAATFVANEDANPVADSKSGSGLIELKVNDAIFETPPASLQVSVSSGNTTLIPNANVTFGTTSDATIRTVRIVPVADKNGSATLTFTVTDNAGKTATATLALTINSVNDRPTITQLNPLSLAENAAAQSISLTGITGGDAEADATIALTVSAVNVGTSTASPLFDTSNGAVLSISPTPISVPDTTAPGSTTLTLKPATDKFGTATIKVTVTDSGGTDNGGVNTTTMSFNVTVGEVNTAPFFTSTIPNQTINQDSTSSIISIGIGDKETPAEKLQLTFDSSNKVLIPNANLTPTGSGSTRGVVITPVKGQSGTSTISVTVTDTGKSDGTGVLSTTTTFTVTVVPATIPNISSIPAQTTPKNTDTGVISFTVSDDNTAAGALSVTATSNNQTLVPNGGIQFAPVDPSNPTLRQMIIRPATDQSGRATITVTVTDQDTPTPSSSSTSFVLTVTGEAPTITQISSPQTVQPGGSLGPIAITVNDKETFAGFLSLSATSSDTSFLPTSAIVFSGSGANRTVTIGPVANRSGSSIVKITVTDSDGQTGSTTFTVQTAAPTPNTPPTISAIANQSVQPNQSTSVIPFTVGDAETAAADLTVTASSSNTTLVPNSNILLGGSGANRTVLVQPASGQTGTAVITLTVRDTGTTGGAAPMTASTSFTVTVSATPANTAPTITGPTTVSIPANGVSGSLTYTVSDVETAAASLNVTAASSNTALIPVANISITASGATRTVVITPAANQAGTATVTFTVTDGQGGTGTATLLVTVTNSPPTITSISNQTINKNTSTAALAFTVGDAETPVANLSLSTSSSNPTLVPNTTANITLGGSGANRTVTVTPAANQVGNATITITVTDGGGLFANSSFTVTVPDNTLPTITSLSNQTINKNTSTAAQTFTIGDAETPVANLSLTTTSSNPTLVPNTTANITLGGSGANRTVTVTPAANQVGNATITITVTDAGSLSANSSFTVTVRQTAPTDGDLNGDGISDILFQDAQGFLAAWFMRGNTLDPVAGASFLTPSNVGDTNYKIVGSGDFNGDGQEDILFQHTDGTLAVWYMSGTTQLSADLLTPATTGDANWRAVGTGDIDRDGKSDIVFQHTNGALAAWMMDGVRLKANGAVALSPNTSGSTWRVAAVADLNGDGNQDLVFQNSTNGDLAAWLMNGTSLITGQSNFLSPSNPGGTWKVVGAGQYSYAFSVTMNGASEVPAVSTAATGSGTVLVQGDLVTVNVSFSGLSGAATAAHFHGPASTSQAAGVIIPLTVTAASSGTVTGSVTATAAQLDMILNGQTYINIHTAANGGGEIRGQVVRDLTAVRKSDLIFQDASLNLGVWYMDGFNLKTAKALSPSNSGGSWKVAAPK